MTFRKKALFFVILFIAGLNLSAAGTEVETQYMAVFMSGKKVGHMMLKREVNEGKVRTTEQVVATITRFGVPVTVDTKEVSIETTKGEPLGFESIMELSAVSMSVKGTVSDDGTVQLRTSSAAGVPRCTSGKWPEGALMAEGLDILARQKGIEEGTEYTAKIFSPAMMKALNAKITVGDRKGIELLGTSVSLTKVITELNIPGAGPIETISYVDEEIEPKKIITSIAGIKMEMIACSREFALSGNEVFDAFDELFLKSPEKLEGIRDAESVEYILLPKEKDYVLNIPTTDSQKVEKLSDGNVKVTVNPALRSNGFTWGGVKPVDAPKGAGFPYKGSDKQILKALKPTRYVQSDNEQIVKLAKGAVGETKDAAEAVRNIEAFVADYIDKTSLSVGYASAVEVAKNRKGDCSEFSILTTALCRAAGIPAQMVMGVAYVGNFGGMKDVFGGHAWVQAYVGGKWIGVDAAFKNAELGGYDAGHIALATGNGNPEDFLQMIKTTGRFEIIKAEIKKDSN